MRGLNFERKRLNFASQFPKGIGEPPDFAGRKNVRRNVA